MQTIFKFSPQGVKSEQHMASLKHSRMRTLRRTRFGALLLIMRQQQGGKTNDGLDCMATFVCNLSNDKLGRGVQLCSCQYSFGSQVSKILVVYSKLKYLLLRCVRVDDLTPTNCSSSPRNLQVISRASTSIHTR